MANEPTRWLVPPSTVTTITDVVGGVSVTDYGAVGNGEHDDTEAVQAACTAAAGGTLLFPEGIFRTQSFSPASNTLVMGMGAGSVIDLIDDGTATSESLRIDGVSNVRVQGLSLCSRDVTSRSGVYGLIYVWQSTGVSVTGCDFGLSPATAVWVGDSDDVEISGNRIDGVLADGINISRGSKHVRITGNHITDTGDDAIGLVSVRADGDVTYVPNEDIIVSGNQITDVTLGTGISIAGGHDIKVLHNTIDGTDAAGIVCWGGPTYFYTYKVLISGNAIRDVGKASGGSATEAGIRIANTRDFQVLDNSLADIPASGIDMGGVVRDFVIRCGPMRSVTACGVLLSPTADATAALLAELWTDLGDTAPAIGTSGDGVIAGIIRGTGDAGVYVIGTVTYPVDGLLIDVDVRDAGAEGINAVSLTESTIRARTSRSAAEGTRVGDSTYVDCSVTSIDDVASAVSFINTTDSTIHGSLVRGISEAAAIWEDATSDYNTIVNNVVKDSTVLTNGANTVTTSANRAY